MIDPTPVPKWLKDMAERYGKGDDLIAAHFPHPRDEPHPEKLNYPWKGHPVDPPQGI